MSIFYEDLLRFYEVAGVDSALSEEPHNRFQESAASAFKRAPVFIVPKDNSLVQRQVEHQLEIPNNRQISDAQSLANQATTLEELRKAIEAFNGCSLKHTAKNTCFADGTPGSALMLIGEAPGRDEDLQGLPFVGRSGQLLNRMLEAIGLSRSGVYIANTVPWRPPGNRTPTPIEMELCRPFIERQIELAKPKLLMAVGGPAAHALTGSKQGILRLRGHWSKHITPNKLEMLVMPTLHPAYLLRMPNQKKLAWQDFLQVKLKLRELGEAI